MALANPAYGTDGAAGGGGLQEECQGPDAQFPEGTMCGSGTCEARYVHFDHGAHVEGGPAEGGGARGGY
eukprot:1161096-Pelagomonas_calceolata.AAC.4